MWGMMNCLKADFYKFNRSNIIKLHLIIPIIAIIVFIGYYIVSPWEEAQKAIAYIQVISIAFPLIISIVVNMVYEQEQEAAFQYFLGIVNKKVVAHFSKLISIFLLGLMSSLIAILGFGIIFYLMGNTAFGIGFYFKESLIVFAGSIIIYMIQYLVVFAFGKGASLGLGIVGSLVSALMLTGLGDRIWAFIPWAYSIRMSSYTALSAANMLPSQPIDMTVIVMSVYILLSIVLLIMFSKQWEGRKDY
ncbi:lantibiotic immunity ABC transporter MutG family permease subunit [Intestinibacter sp.]